MQQLGIVSDTHGPLHPAVAQALAGCDRVLHAGDIGGGDVLQALDEIAPVVAVRGNMDLGPWAQNLPKSQVIEVDGLYLYMLHDVHALDLEPRRAGFAAVISGHTHRPHLEEVGGVLYVNPGSAGKPPAGFAPSVARMIIDGGTLRVAFCDLDP